MRIAQIIPGMGIHCGGPSRSVLSLAQGLRDLFVDSDIITNNDIEDPLIASEPWIHAVPYHRNYFGYNKAFCAYLRDADYDIFHIHSVYNYTSTIAMRIARNRGIPFIVSPRGSLLKSAMSISSKYKKQLFNKLILINDLSHSSVLHATSDEEMLDIYSLGVKCPFAVIPNSIKLSTNCYAHDTSVFRIGVCGRINPKKNIDGIIKAWAHAGMNNVKAELLIIGGAKHEKEMLYLKELHKLEKDLEISNIIWTGPVYGYKQKELLCSLSALLLGSHSENFGMVVPESLSLGVPVIASYGTPWEILQHSNSGWWIDNSVESIATCLKEVYHLYCEDISVLREMGNNGIELVKKNYSQEAVAKQWIDVYTWILKGGETPPIINIFK